MKRALTILVLIFCFSCSVEDDRLPQDDVVSMDLLITEDVCTILNLKFGDEGTLEVRNYYDYIEVSVINTPQSKPLTNFSIDFALPPEVIPTKGKGDNIQPNTAQFYFNEKVEGDPAEYTRQFSFSELGIATGDGIEIAAVAEFGSKKDKEEIIARDFDQIGNNFVFSYSVEPFVNYAGSDKILEITLSDAIAIDSWDNLRKKYVSMLDPGVNKKGRDFNPELDHIIRDFNNNENKIGDYPTLYTLGTGDCSDSALLTLRVVPDPL